jgi:hypothetical protein
MEKIFKEVSKYILLNWGDLNENRRTPCSRHGNLDHGQYTLIPDLG